MKAMKLPWPALVMALGLALPTSAPAQESGGGTVAETMGVGSYVYIRLEESGAWLATSPVEVAVGDEIEFAGAFPMAQFYSPALERTFDEILFVGSVTVVSATPEDTAAAMAAMHGRGLPQGHPEVLDGGAAVEPLEGGTTIGAVYQAAAGETVSLRANVVKFSPEILGRNWVTLQDGTGTPPDDRLVATTTETVAVGDVVVVTGTVGTDVDLGYGYRYKVVLEDATFSR